MLLKNCFNIKQFFILRRLRDDFRILDWVEVWEELRYAEWNLVYFWGQKNLNENNILYKAC